MKINTKLITRRSNMLYTDFTEKLIGLQGVKVTKVEKSEKEINIFAQMQRKPHFCPVCNKETTIIHDYRTQTIKDINAFGRSVLIHLKKRRYRCGGCGKRFFEQNIFLPKYQRSTTRLKEFIIDRLRCECSYTSIAKETGLSVSTVIRYFDCVSYPRAKLSEVIAIDEFKGNTNGEKYQCILTDPKNKVVLDILPQRYSSYLTKYFKEYSQDERQKVKYFISDMWKTYSETAGVWFKNSTQIVDKYHWIRQAVWAFENVRKQEQKKLGPELRKYFKRSRSLLIRRTKNLTEEQKHQVAVMLYYSVNLSRAYYCKEDFLNILSCTDKNEARKAMSEWIANAECCSIPQFEKCAGTMRNWYSGIINSFSVEYMNGFTEGCNNKIKVLKRNAYGYRNFKRFRNRILHMFSYQRDKLTAATC